MLGSDVFCGLPLRLVPHGRQDECQLAVEWFVLRGGQVAKAINRSPVMFDLYRECFRGSSLFSRSTKVAGLRQHLLTKSISPSPSKSA